MTSALDNLVTSGTLTSDQEISILNAIEEGRNSNTQSSTSTDETQNPMKNMLDSLVTSGTITQTQEDSINSAFQNSSEN